MSSASNQNILESVPHFQANSGKIYIYLPIVMYLRTYIRKVPSESKNSTVGH